MSDNLPTRLRVSALIRRAGQAGGSAMVLARGDDTSGGLLILCMERGVPVARIESVFDGSHYAFARVGGDAPDGDYVRKRRRMDPDLWVIELDIAAPERFAAETLNAG